MRFNPLTIIGLNASLPVVIALYPSSRRLIFAIVFALGILMYLKQIPIILRAIMLFVMFFTLYTLSLYFLPIPPLIMFFRMIYMIAPCILLALALFRCYNSTEIFASLEHLHLPKTFVLALALTLRYVPTFMSEFKLIREAMETRGIRISLTHPIKALEYFIVPQLFRCLALSNELTAASLCRGALSTACRARYFDLPFTYLDILAILIFISGIIFF